jgi:hypothetical protein
MRTLNPSYRSLLLSIAFYALGVVSVARAITPTPPVDVDTEFTPGAGLAGSLVVRFTANVPVRQVVLSISAPPSFEVGFSRGSPKHGSSRDQVDYSLGLGDRFEKGVASEAVKISTREGKERESWPIEVRVTAIDAEGATAIGHRTLIATIRDGRLLVQSPEAYQRLLRVEADALVRQASPRDRGYNIEDVLVGAVTKVDGVSLSKESESRGDEKSLEVYPSPLSAWERGTFVDRSQESAKELDPLTIRGQAFFEDFDGVTRPLVNATVRVMDDDWGPDEHITSTITGWDGRFSTVVNNSDGWFQDGRDIYIRVLTTNSRFRTEDCSYWPDWTYAWRANDGDDLSDGTIVEFGSFSLAGDTNAQRAAMVFQRLNSGWNHFTGTGSQDPGFVDSCYPESPTVYDTFWGEVDISGSDFDSRDSVVHEWGHAIQDNAQIFNAWSGDAHSFCGLTSREQAFVEGWATFVALDVFPDNRFNWNPGDTGRELENYSCAASRSNADGPRDEGRVVAALRDLRDANDDCTGGCGSTCDANRATTVGLPTIWRDSMWGTVGIFTDDAFEFWRELCPAMTATQRPAAVNISDYSCIDVSLCRAPSNVLEIPPTAASDVAVADLDAALRRLRDELKQTEAGRRLVETFAGSAAELATLAERDAAARKSMEMLRVRLANTAVWLTNEEGQYEDRIPVTPEMLAEFDSLAGSIRKRGDSKQSGNLSHTRMLLADVEGRTVAEIRSKLATAGRKD